jgi:WD40 repeat protein
LRTLPVGGPTRSIVTAVKFIDDANLITGLRTPHSPSRDNIQKWSVATGKLIKTFSDTGSIEELSCSADGKLIASIASQWSSDRSGIDLWDTSTCRRLRKLKACQVDGRRKRFTDVTSGAFGENNTLFAGQCDNSEGQGLFVWDVKLLKIVPLRELAGSEQMVMRC